MHKPEYKLKLATAEVEATVEKIIRTVDAATLARQKNARELKRNDVGEINKEAKRMIRKLKTGAIPDEIMEFALVEMQKILSGEIIFVVQDEQLMQVEVTQRRRQS